MSFKILFRCLACCILTCKNLARFLLFCKKLARDLSFSRNWHDFSKSCGFIRVLWHSVKFTHLLISATLFLNASLKKKQRCVSCMSSPEHSSLTNTGGWWKKYTTSNAYARNLSFCRWVPWNNLYLDKNWNKRGSIIIFLPNILYRREIEVCEAYKFGLGFQAYHPSTRLCCSRSRPRQPSGMDPIMSPTTATLDSLSFFYRSSVAQFFRVRKTH